MRNARELAEHLGHSDFQGSWPTFDDTVYLPKPNHTGENASIHIDDLPIIGSANSLPSGETGHIVQQPAKADVITTDGSTNLLDGVSERGDSHPPDGPEYSLSPNDESQWGDTNPPDGPAYSLSPNNESQCGNFNSPGGPAYSPSSNNETQWGDSNSPDGPEYSSSPYGASEWGDPNPPGRARIQLVAEQL